MSRARLRGPKLTRYLLASAFPATLGIVLPIPGCACPEATSTFPIDAADHEALLSRYGSEALPSTECERLCVIGAADGGGGMGGSGAGGGDTAQLGFDAVSECSLTTIELSVPAVACTGVRNCGGVGRRPPGWVAAQRQRDSQEGGKAGRSEMRGSAQREQRGDVGEYFAAMSQLEAASVLAFEHLASELRSHGAPPTLVRRARRAAADEVRHARVTASLARRHGAVVPPVHVRLPGVRSLVAIAIDNAAEGCVGESYGAALLAHQAAAAEDAAVGRALGAIARDEAAHAELSFDLADWLAPRIGARGRRLVRRAGERALAAALAEIDAPDAGVARKVGIPRAAANRALVERVRVLWVSAA